MNYNDDDLQQKIENNQLVNDDDLDIKAYRIVFNSLDKLPEEKLSASFADRVVAKVIERRKREGSRDLWWFGIGMVFLVISCIAAFVFAELPLTLGFLKNISSYTGVFVFGAAFIIALNLLEKKVIQRRPDL